MATPVTTCTDIELAVLAELTNRLEGLRAAANQKDAQGLYPGPTVSVAIFEGGFERVTQTTYKQTATVNVLLTFKHERGEEERRKGINPLVQGVVQYLMLRDLGLAMELLKPRRFREVTDDEDYEARKIVYLIEFGTSFTVTKMEEEEAVDLLRVGLNYFLKPGDDVADASDILTFSGVTALQFDDGSTIEFDDGQTVGMVAGSAAPLAFADGSSANFDDGSDIEP